MKYIIKYINIETAERINFEVTSHRDLEIQLEKAGINDYDPFWMKLGTSDVIPITE